jgi:hypothetical protein
MGLTIVDFIKQQYADGALTKPYDAYQKLLANPDAFMRGFAVDIDEGTGIGSSVRNAFIVNGGTAKRPGEVLGVKRMHTTESFRIRERPDAELTDRMCYYPFPAHFVAMHPSNIKPIPWYALRGGPDVMLTCKLTGCSFVVRKQNNVVEAAHLQPQEESGLDLNKRLQGGGQVAFGRVNYDLEKRTITILGVRSGGRWRMFAQKWNKMETKTPTILSVHEFFHE